MNVPSNSVLLDRNKLIRTVQDLCENSNGKQETLESGVNIRTINGQSLLGDGDITIGGGGRGVYTRAG